MPEGDEEVLALDTRRGRYRRLLVREDGRLAAAILLDAGALRELLVRGDEVPGDLLDGHGDAPAGGYGDPSPCCSRSAAVAALAGVRLFERRDLIAR